MSSQDPSRTASAGRGKSTTSNTIIKSIKDAKAYLSKKNLIAPTDALSSLSISALLHGMVTDMKMPEDVANTAKSIAFLMEEIVEDEAIRSITASAETAINTMVQNATEKLDDTIKRNVEVINAMVTRQGEATIEAEKTAEHFRTSLTQLSSAPTANISTVTQSYRDALAGPSTTLNPTNAASMKIMNRMAIQSRQVLIKPDATAAAANQNRTPEQLKEIKTKVTETIAKLTKPENLDASPRAVTITRGGLILIEMGNPEAANWFQTDETTKQFIQEFDPKAAVKRRNFPIILKFVPIEWNPDSQDELRDLETRHGLEANTIISATWIKDPTKRRAHQEVCLPLITSYKRNKRQKQNKRGPPSYKI